MLMCLQDVGTLSVSLGFWVQKNFVIKDDTSSSKMERKEKNKEKGRDGQ